jgi:hypothetical protein
MTLCVTFVCQSQSLTLHTEIGLRLAFVCLLRPRKASSENYVSIQKVIAFCLSTPGTRPHYIGIPKGLPICNAFSFFYMCFPGQYPYLLASVERVVRVDGMRVFRDMQMTTLA